MLPTQYILAIYQSLKYTANMKQNKGVLENEIQTLAKTLQNHEDIDPAYMNDEMKKLRHYTLYTHSRMEESLGHLLIKNQLAPLGSVSIPQETYQQVFASGTTIAIEIDFARKVELARSCGQIDKVVSNALHEVNTLRKWFSHPSKYYEKLTELVRDRSNYKSKMELLVNAHSRMNDIFEKILRDESKQKRR